MKLALRIEHVVPPTKQRAEAMPQPSIRTRKQLSVLAIYIGSGVGTVG